MQLALSGTRPRRLTSLTTLLSRTESRKLVMESQHLTVEALALPAQALVDGEATDPRGEVTVVDSAAVADMEEAMVVAATVAAMEVDTAAMVHLHHPHTWPRRAPSSTLAICHSRLVGKSSRTSSEPLATLCELTSTWAPMDVPKDLESSFLPPQTMLRTQFRCTTGSTGTEESSKFERCVDTSDAQGVMRHAKQLNFCPLCRVNHRTVSLVADLALAATVVVLAAAEVSVAVMEAVVATALPVVASAVATEVEEDMVAATAAQVAAVINNSSSPLLTPRRKSSSRTCPGRLPTRTWSSCSKRPARSTKLRFSSRAAAPRA